MVSMPRVQSIRRSRRNGESVASIARKTHVSEPTVRRYLAKEDLSAVPSARKPRASVIDPYLPVIGQWLAEDRADWRERRHAATRIWERSGDGHGAEVSLSTVARPGREFAAERDEAFMDLVWHPGGARADFGEVDVLLRGVVQRMHHFVLDFPYSNVGLVRLMPGENAEDNVRILAHFRIPALMERDMGRAGYDFQSPDNEKPRLERGTEPCPRKSYSSTRPCSRASSTSWCERRSSGSSTRCPTLQADEIANAARYERSDGRRAYRAGHYERSLTAKAGKLGLRVPKLKGAVFESAVIERYRRREESVEEALIDMYLAGVSTRRVDDISQLLWEERMPSQTLSDKLKKAYGDIDSWRTRPLEGEYPYVFMDGVWHKRSWCGHVENVSVLVAIGVNKEGHREVIGVAEGMKEDRDSWEQFVRGMIERGLKGVRLVVGDRCAGLVSTVNSMLPKARYQRCMVHFMRNVLSKTPPSHREWASVALKAIFAMESRETALAKAEQVATEMEGRRLKAAADCLREGTGETTTYLLPEFPDGYRRRIRTNNMIERLNREIRRRTRVVGSFPDGNSALMLVCARIRYVTANEWSTRRYLDMSRLDDTLQAAN